MVRAEQDAPVQEGGQMPGTGQGGDLGKVDVGGLNVAAKVDEEAGLDSRWRRTRARPRRPRPGRLGFPRP